MGLKLQRPFRHSESSPFVSRDRSGVFAVGLFLDDPYPLLQYLHLPSTWGVIVQQREQYLNVILKRLYKLVTKCSVGFLREIFQDAS